MSENHLMILRLRLLKLTTILKKTLFFTGNKLGRKKPHQTHSTALSCNAFSQPFTVDLFQ